MKGKRWVKFKNSYTRLIVLTISTMLIGLTMLIVPEGISSIIIRGVGIVWTLDAISLIIEISDKVKRKNNE